MLSERQEQILLSLKRFDYLTVKQLQQLHDLKGNRNAYRVMKQLEPYLHTFKDDGVNIYYLNKKGREAVACDKERKKLTTARHYIMRNNLYIHLDQPANWENEVKITLDPISVIADAHFITNRHYLVEIDHVQKMKANEKKIEKYRRLIERNAFKGMPGVIWVTTTPYRRDRLMELCEGLDSLILLDTDIK
ncbi:replication-relaxation family protein [Virgibacillus halophilus]|uniref:Replication-relaxation family protein n=1 Tax=Tigheibacillus halophilus TaxID=361280 RepID=A0ABU5C6X1_9BACI|nr:replication-relaxation family protein [Virgibacillus halophilus]